MSPIPTAPAATPSPAADAARARGAALLALLLLVVGTCLRCHDVARLSINGDEIYSVWETRSARKAANATDLVGAWSTRFSLITESNPADPPGIPKEEVWRLRWGYRTNPLSLLINEAAFELFGETPLAIRLGSLLFALAALIVLPWMARPLIGARGALLLLALIALCPDHVAMARDARYRSACFLFGGMAAIAAARFARDRKPRDEWLCLGACVLLVLSHLTGLLVAATLFLYLALVARGRISVRLLPLAALLAIVAWRFGPHAKVGEVIQQGIVGKARYPSWRLAASIAYNVGPAVFALGLVAVATIRRQGSRALAPLLAAAAIPTVVLFWMNHRSDVGPRYFGAIVAIGVVLAAAGAETLFRWFSPRVARTLFGLALATQLPLLASDWIDGQRYPYADAARVVHDVVRPGDRVVSDWSGIVEYYFEEELLDDRHVMEMPDSLPKLEERLIEGNMTRAFLIFPRQRGEIAWPGGAGGQKRLRDWLAAHGHLIATLGHKRLDSWKVYWFEIEIHEVDVAGLR